MSHDSAEAFGLWEYPQMLNKINRLLAPHGIRLKAKTNYREWGDQILITVEPRPQNRRRPNHQKGGGA